MKIIPSPSKTSLPVLPLNSRSTADHHAAHSVGETVGEQAGDVVVHDLHLTALELSHLKQANLVLLGVLGEHRKMKSINRVWKSPAL